MKIIKTIITLKTKDNNVINVFACKKENIINQ